MFTKTSDLWITSHSSSSLTSLEDVDILEGESDLSKTEIIKSFRILPWIFRALFSDIKSA
jgi:hypothetical protein